MGNKALAVVLIVTSVCAAAKEKNNQRAFRVATVHGLLLG